ncbi:hypothetical protein BASA83_013097 [Batrachochytrium salamandrivorans]|nr:hypothetical protein BASA83_013097 [Batrachochytrium salamandrivorans]
MGLFLGTLGWRDTIPKSIGSPEWWILDLVIVWKIVVLGRLDSRSWESLQETSISRAEPSIPNLKYPTRLLTLLRILDIDASLFKDPSMDLDLGIKKPLLQKTSTLEIGLIRRNDSTEVYPFLEVSPVSETPIPLNQ